jgi:hypothetical protein
MFKPYILLSYFLYLDQFNLVSVFTGKMESQSPKMNKEGTSGAEMERNEEMEVLPV